MVKQERDYATILSRIINSFKNFGQLMTDHAGNQLRALEDKLGEARDKVFLNQIDPTLRGTERVQAKRQLHTLEIQRYDAIHGENAALRDKSEELIKIWKTFSNERVREINAQIDELDREIHELRMDPTLDSAARQPLRDREIQRSIC